MLDRVSNLWKPDYDATMTWRILELQKLRADQRYLAFVLESYRDDPVGFIHDWGMTFDPRNAGVEGKMTTMPFTLFRRQEELVEALYSALRSDAHLLVEKSRDMGATWLCVWISIHLFLFWKGTVIGWGSRKAGLVDTLGVMDSIFEKIRWGMRQLPDHFKPDGFGEHCMAQMKIYAPSTGSSIIGEGGDDIGRGGRTRIYFKDESAHYERPELIEASLGDNTRVQVDISSVHGLGNVFHRKAESATEWVPGMRMERGRQYKFIMDWRDHPLKDQTWYDERRAKAEEEGLLHVLAQEVDRDYSASVEGTIIPADWVQSAIDAHLHPSQRQRRDEWESGGWMAGLDVAGGDSSLGSSTRSKGGAKSSSDRNALALRRGSILRRCEEWGDRDTGVTTRRAVGMVEALAPLEVQYDCIGVGEAVKAETNRLVEEGLMPEGIRFVPWNAGATPIGADTEPPKRVIPDDKDSPLVKDFYGNLKAQGWWELRRRFEKTHRAVTDGVYYPVEEMISIDGSISRLRSLQKELSQPTASKSTAKLKLIVDKTPEGTRSPNMADATMQCFWPAHAYYYDTSNDWVG